MRKPNKFKLSIMATTKRNQRKHLKTPMERFFLETTPGKIVLAILSPAILPFYMIKKAHSTAVFCCTATLDGDVDQEFSEIFDAYESTYRDSDGSHMKEVRMVQNSVDRNMLIAQQADQAKAIAHMSAADELMCDIQGMPQNEIDARQRVHQLAAHLAEPPIPISQKNLDDWRQNQCVNDALDKENEYRAKFHGERRKRLKRKHYGLFLIVDEVKAKVSYRGTATNAVRLSTRDMVNNAMKNRTWRTKDIAGWIDLAVEMVLTPTRAEISAMMVQHSAASRARNAEYQELCGVKPRC